MPMNPGYVWCSLLCILLVISAGCMAPGQHTNATAAEGTQTTPASRETLSFGDASVEPQSAPAPVPTSTIRKKPVFYGSSSRTINGSGLSANATNSTSALVDYLTNEQDYSNETAKKAEITFWNKVATEIRKKIDGENPVTRDFALSAVSHSGTYNAEQVCDLYDRIAPPNWTYVSDPAESNVSFWDYFASASESISIGLKGDCDDFAILNAALVEAIGGKSRVVYAVSPSTNAAHMYAEARFDDTSFISIIEDRYSVSKVNYRPGYWLNLDWQQDYPGGNYFTDSGIIWVIYSDGTWQKLGETSDGYTVLLSGP